MKDFKYKSDLCIIVVSDAHRNNDDVSLGIEHHCYKEFESKYFLKKYVIISLSRTENAAAKHPYHQNFINLGYNHLIPLKLYC